MKVLECSSQGDKRFSALYAKLKVDDKIDTIENWYQLAKRFGDSPPPKTWREAKGKRPTHIEWKGKKYELQYLTLFYNHLWELYLDQNPELHKVLLEYDEFTDMFSKPWMNSQAQAIKIYKDKKLI